VPHGSVRWATPMVRAVSVMPQAVRVPKKPGPNSVAIDAR
jgi:hypothetical protein